MTHQRQSRICGTATRHTKVLIMPRAKRSRLLQIRPKPSSPEFGGANRHARARYDGRFANGSADVLHLAAGVGPMSMRRVSLFLFALFSAIMLGLAAGAASMLLAAGATALAAIYVNMLIAGVKIAGNMGLGLIDTLRTAGIGMLWQLTRMAMAPADLIWTALAMLLAAWLARGRRPRRR